MSGATVTIENLRAVPTLLTLDYRDAREPALAVRQKRAKLHKGKDGWRSIKVEHARLSESISLRPRGKEGCQATGLPPAVENCADVQTKIAAKWIKLTHLTAAETAEQAAKLQAQRERRADGQKRLAERLADRRRGPTAGPAAAPSPRKRRRAAAAGAAE